MMQHLKINMQLLSRKYRTLHQQLLSLRKYSNVAAAAETSNEPTVQYCNKEAHEHTTGDLHKMYSIPNATVNGRLVNAVPKRYTNLCKAIHDNSILIRKPAIDIIDTIKQSTSDPIPKFLIYGPDGGGKSLTLMHVIQYCLLRNMVVIHIPNAVSMVDTQRRTTVQESIWNSSRVDQPAESITWLNMFRNMNESFLMETKTTKEYTWGKREMTEKGEPLMSVLEQGVGRTLSANDAVGVLLKEIRQNKDIEVLYAVDAINGLFSQTSHRLNGKLVDLNSLSLVHHFTKLMKPEHSLKRGAYVMAVSRSVQYLKPAIRQREVYSVLKNLFDRYALARFNDYTHLEVPYYSEEEFMTMLHYYKEHDWLARDLSEKLIKELRFVTGRSPTHLRKTLASL